MSTKRSRSLNEYKGHKGQATLTHVERNIEKAYPMAWENLTGIQYGCVMNVANLSFHDGKSSAGAEKIDNCVYVDGNMYPIELLNKITFEEYVLENEYNKKYGTTYHGTIVKFEGKEIARYPYAL